MIIRYFFLSLMFALFAHGKSVAYMETFASHAKESLGKDVFAREMRQWEKTESFQKMKKAMSLTVEKKIGKKNTVSMLPFADLFNIIKEDRSSLILPEFYAHELMLLSYGVASEKFNNEYGKAFSEELKKRRVCEGYLWSSHIKIFEERDLSSAKEDLENAILLCKTKRHIKRAKLDIAKVNYFLQKKKRR